MYCFIYFSFFYEYKETTSYHVLPFNSKYGGGTIMLPPALIYATIQFLSYFKVWNNSYIKFSLEQNICLIFKLKNWENFLKKNAGKKWAPPPPFFGGFDSKTRLQFRPNQIREISQEIKSKAPPPLDEEIWTFTNKIQRW